MYFLPNRLATVVLGVFIVLLGWSGMSPFAVAQQTRTLSIQDGTVYVDGTSLSEDQVPEGLDLDGLTAQYHFVGVQRPVVELDGQLFAVTDRLIPVTRDERNAQMEGQSGGQSDAEAIPTAHEQYLQDVQQSSRELYERLQRERVLEKNAKDLARAIRILPDGERRRGRIDSLRALLNNLFELKQANHRREIEHLQRQIQELQRRLQKRQEMRASMIQNRLEHLVGAEGNK